MACIDNLPPEVLEQCFLRLGFNRAHYNDRERQHDLTVVARVSRLWHLTANALLYSSPAAANTGRASLLEDVVSKRPEYASMALRFAWHAKNGLVDGALLNDLLSKLPNLKRIEIGAQLLQSQFLVTQLSDTIRLLPLRSFNCGSSWVSPLAHVVPLLPEMPHLKELDLFNFFDIYANDIDFLKEADGIKPIYDLDTLIIRSIDQLSPARLAWLLGRTRSLRKLCLGISTKLPKGGSEEIVDLLRPFAPTLHSVEVTVDSKMSREADGRHGVSVAHLLLPKLSHAAHLTLGGHHMVDMPSLAMLRHDKLECLTLLDGWLVREVGQLIFDDRLPSLKELCVINLSRSDPRTKDLAWKCDARDVKLSLERRFG